MLALSAEDMRRAVTLPEAMDAVAAAFAQLSGGQATVPLRPRVPDPALEELLLVMPAYLAGSGALRVKALTLYGRNPSERGIPAIAALVLPFDVRDGRPQALLDGKWLT